MSEKEKQLFVYLSRADEAVEVLKNKGLAFVDPSFIWQTLQIEFECTETPTEIIFKNLTVADIVAIVLKNRELYGQPICEIEIKDSILPDEVDDSLIKAYLKFKGDIWVVHKHDKDNFPSNPHAHNYDTNMKLHLGDGRLFKKKVSCGRIKKKDLIFLRRLIQERMPLIKLPQLKLSQ